MKSYLSVVLATLLVGCASASEGADTVATTISSTTIASTTISSTTAVSEPAVDWLADLDLLDSGVRRVHPNPFWRVSEEEWNAKLAAAREIMPTLGRHQAEMVLFELTALLDGHSGIYPSEIGYHMYGLRLYHFTDGYFLLDGPDPSAIGGELVAINGVPVADAVAKVMPLIAHDNDKVFEVVVPMYLASSTTRRRQRSTSCALMAHTRSSIPTRCCGIRTSPSSMDCQSVCRRLRNRSHNRVAMILSGGRWSTTCCTCNTTR